MNIEDYRAVRINDCEDENVSYGVIMLNNKHTIKEFQAVINNIKNKYFNEGNLDFVVVNMHSYRRYNTSIREDGRIQISSSHPYDEQEYHYAIGNKIYRNGKYVETIKESKEHFIDGLDEIILRLIELDRPLKSIMCHN